MMPDLGLSQVQIGALETAFIAGYTVMQFPGGIIGQRLGARMMFVVIGLAAVASTMAMPIAPWLLQGTALFGVLAAAQFTLGCSHAPILPVSTGAFEAWFQRSLRLGGPARPRSRRHPSRGDAPGNCA